MVNIYDVITHLSLPSQTKRYEPVIRVNWLYAIRWRTEVSETSLSKDHTNHRTNTYLVTTYSFCWFYMVLYTGLYSVMWQYGYRNMSQTIIEFCCRKRTLNETHLDWIVYVMLCHYVCLQLIVFYRTNFLQYFPSEGPKKVS